MVESHAEVMTHWDHQRIGAAAQAPVTWGVGVGVIFRCTILTKGIHSNQYDFEVQDKDI